MGAGGSAIYYIMILALIVPAWLALRGNPKKELKNALIWVIILAILVLGWQAFH